MAAGYLLATFPYLMLDDGGSSVDAGSLDEFIEDCEIHFPEAKAHEVRIAVLDPGKSALPIARQWWEYTSSVKNEIAKKRHQRKRSGAYTATWADGMPVTADALYLCSQLAQTENPLQAELAIYHQNWATLEFLDAQYQMSVENVIVYGWRLQEYISFHNITKERGEKTWGHLVDVLTEKAGFSQAYQRIISTVEDTAVNTTAMTGGSVDER